MDLLPADDPSLTDEVSWVPASPLPEEPVQVTYIYNSGSVDRKIYLPNKKLAFSGTYFAL